MHVLIAGAGLGGITLAAVLEKAGISYLVIERAQDVKPLGSAMGISVNIHPVLKQLGVFQEIVQNSQPIKRGTNRTYPTGGFFSRDQVDDYSTSKERYGDYSYIITRPRLYEIMCKLIPKEKIAYGKKVLSIQQNSQGVMARCSDGEHLHADVLIGADGAYSSVRQNMFTQMMEKGLLPEEDASDPPFNTLCLVGVTRPMPPGTFEVVEGECRADGMIYKGHPYSSSCFSQPDGSVAWLVLQHAGSFKTRSEERFRSSEWGSEDAETMATTVRDLPSPFGHTLGYFIDNTPKTGISKVMLEEKIYKTWTYGRVALLGDACHKFFPAAGQGAVSAIQDAVVLANVLEACPTTHIDDVRRCLEAYYEERFPLALNSYKVSRNFAMFFKKNTKGDLLRFVMRILPRSIVTSQLDRLYATRPQCVFLPLIKSEGQVEPLPLRNYDHLRTTLAPVVL